MTGVIGPSRAGHEDRLPAPGSAEGPAGAPGRASFAGMRRHALLLPALWLALAGGCGRAAPPRGEEKGWARPLTNVRFEPTEARRARGEYLANGALQCVLCHSARDWTAPGAPPLRGREFAGALMRDDGNARLVAPNLTPDRATGAASWSDDMLARAIREGVGHDGRALHPLMWYGAFRGLADEDVASLVVYLRSLPPVRNALPRTRLSDERRDEIEAELRPLRTPVPMPDTSQATERGRYLVRAADCAGCHTSWYSARNPGLLAGGNLVERDTFASFSTNITGDATGIGGLDSAGFATVMRTGRWGTLSPVMPWAAFRALSDRDLEAIRVFLRALPTARHAISNGAQAESCAACGQRHGLGGLNRPEVPRGLALDERALEAYAGRYEAEGPGYWIEVRREGTRLLGVDDTGARADLVPVAADRFLAPGWLAPVRFERDPAGSVTALVSIEVDDVRFARVPAR